MTFSTWFALFVFIATVFAIAAGRMHRSVATLLGAVTLMVFHILPAEKAVTFIDFNTIGLLMGMMIIVGVLSRTGVFQYIAVRTVKLTRGYIPAAFVAIMLVTAFLSAVLDNVTTVLLISPIVISLVELVDVNPIPFLIGEAFASNIGGTATLVGDPPNIIIGSFAHFSFMDFLLNLAPVVVVIMAVVSVWLVWSFRDTLFTCCVPKERIAGVDESRLIKDPKLLKRAFAAMGLVLAGFAVHHLVHLPAAVVALFGAALLLAVIPVDGGEVIQKDVEWSTLVFFATLFMVVGGLKETGLIALGAARLTDVLQGHPVLALLSVLWISGLACAFINNVAFTATFVYVVDEMAVALGVNAEPLFWTLALGACLGGNGTYLGAAANVIVADMAERSGQKISFSAFMKLGFQVVLISLAISSAYVVLRYGGAL